MTVRSAPLRILLWSPGGAGSHYHGPATSSFRIFAEIKARRDCRITLAHINPEQSDASPVIDTIVDFSEGGAKRAGSLVEQLRFVAAGNAWLRKNARSFDVLYTPAANKITLGPAATAARLGLPAVGRVAALNAELYDASGLRAVLGFNRTRVAWMKQLAGVVAISQRVRSRLLELGLPESRIFDLPNGVDTRRFHPADADEKRRARARFGVPAESGPVVVVVGAVGDRKGQHLLVEALPHLPPDVHLLIVGPTRELDYAARLEARAVELGVAARISRSEHVSDVEAAYWAGDIFVLASTDEGMPNALLEAMACSLACVGTPISGIEDLLGEGDRGTLRPRAQEALNAALKAYCESPELRERHGAAARRHIEAHHANPLIADRLFEVLHRNARGARTEPNIAAAWESA